MNIINADIRDLWKNGEIVCVTTNGYIRQDGKAVMGRGNAKAMAEIIPKLPVFLGECLERFGNSVYFIYTCVIAFPVKPESCTYTDVLPRMKHAYNETSIVPGFHCQASPDLIKKSANELVNLIEQLKIERVYLPLPGIGNGGLKMQDIKEALDIIESCNKIQLVRW